MQIHSSFILSDANAGLLNTTIAIRTFNCLRILTEENCEETSILSRTNEEWVWMWKATTACGKLTVRRWRAITTRLHASMTRLNSFAAETQSSRRRHRWKLSISIASSHRVGELSIDCFAEISITTMPLLILNYFQYITDSYPAASL